ncbi:hypothetical protein D3C71_1625060 [compost metagenome]
MPQDHSAELIQHSGNKQLMLRQLSFGLLIQLEDKLRRSGKKLHSGSCICVLTASGDKRACHANFLRPASRAANQLGSKDQQQNGRFAVTAIIVVNVSAAAKRHISLVEKPALQINPHSDGTLTHIYKFKIIMPMGKKIQIMREDGAEREAGMIHAVFMIGLHTELLRFFKDGKPFLLG